MKTLGELEIVVEHNNDQLKRLISHFDSEQKNSVNQGKRIDSNEVILSRLVKQIEEHDAVIFNRGKGLSFEVDRLVLEAVKRKDSSRWNTATIISIISAMTSVGAVLITLMITK